MFLVVSPRETQDNYLHLSQKRGSSLIAHTLPHGWLPDLRHQAPILLTSCWLRCPSVYPRMVSACQKTHLFPASAVGPRFPDRCYIHTVHRSPHRVPSLPSGVVPTELASLPQVCLALWRLPPVCV